MNLYIWGDSRCVAYGADTLIVMARNLREAKKIAKEKCVDWSFGSEHKAKFEAPHTKHGKLGKPARVIRAKPYAAYFMASE